MLKNLSNFLFILIVYLQEKIPLLQQAGTQKQIFYYQKEHHHVINASSYEYYNRIVYNDNSWVLYDGDGIKPSTNGTWIYLKDPHEITNELIFKVAQTLFKTKIFG